MNTTRIALGGVAAGLLLNVTEGILNAVILMDDYEALMQTYGLPEASWAMAGYIGGCFVFGFALAWLYAAIRPRFGPGWGTGVRAGVLLWAVAYAVPSIWFGAMGMGLSTGKTVLALVWGLVEMVGAGVLAGWIYREEEGAA
ncbi:MAG: hypothetical protein AMXMBFR53_31580 [Gemmatimonadota bacterium]